MKQTNSNWFPVFSLLLTLLLGNCTNFSPSAVQEKETEPIITTNYAPEILNLTSDRAAINVYETMQITCNAKDPEGDSLQFEWSVYKVNDDAARSNYTINHQSSGGEIINQNNQATWNPPFCYGRYLIICLVKDIADQDAADYILVDVAVTENSNNPVLIKYDPAREEKVQNLWHDFLITYNADTLVEEILTDEITSYVTSVDFKQGIPVFSPEEEIADKIPTFFQKWKGLFGADLQLDEANLTERDGFLSVSFDQSQYNPYNFKYTNNSGITFHFKSDGTLWQIKSSLIPDLEINIPIEINNDAMLQNIVGHTFEQPSPDFTSVHQVTFDDSYEYQIQDNWWIHRESYEDGYLFYLLKGIRALQPTNIFDYFTYDVLCHPDNNKVVHIVMYGFD